jgi:8-oxo-dGTP diphosphatase
MKRIQLPAPVLRAASPAVQLWWKIRKPRTFGVKVLLWHPANDGRFLVVRHSYTDTRRWGLPGGGYRPTNETAQQAASREVSEELGLRIDPNLITGIESLTSTLEVKRDSLTIVATTAPDAPVSLSTELAEARWVGSLTELGDAPISRWLVIALDRAR